MRTHEFDSGRLIDDAVAAAGVDDFGGEGWREGLDRVLESLGAEADLNDVGVAMVEAEMVGYLSNRLQIVEWRRTHPDVAAEAIRRPLVIVGQPRTGTTILYDLLAQDPANRAPLTWEVDCPCPPPTRQAHEADPRIEETDATCAMADVIVPGFTDFHPLGARLAQECVRMTGSNFRSMIFTVQYRVPSYNRWLLYEADLTTTYAWHRVFLQHLQSGMSTDRWLLKSPAHLWHIGSLLAEYPDVVLIQTHRDPVKVIASVSALAAHLRRMASDHPTVADAAEQYAEDIVVGLNRSLEARRSGLLPSDQVVDVHFADFMADPFATIGTLYDQLGVELTAEAEGRMRTFLATHPGDGGGAGTRYTWADTGLDADALREQTRDYEQEFAVPREPLI